MDTGVEVSRALKASGSKGELLGRSCEEFEDLDDPSLTHPMHW